MFTTNVLSQQFGVGDGMVQEILTGRMLIQFGNVCPTNPPGKTRFWLDMTGALKFNDIYIIRLTESQSESDVAGTWQPWRKIHVC